MTSNDLIPETRATLEKALAELEADIEVLNSFVLAAQVEQEKLVAQLHPLRARLALSAPQTFAETAPAGTSTPR